MKGGSMACSMFDLLRTEVKKMASGIEKNKKGNIYPLIIQEIEKYLIKIVLEETKGSLVVTANILGISRSTLYRKMQELKLLDKSDKKDKKLLKNK
jgi:DNA-binding protein Fis